MATHRIVYSYIILIFSALYKKPRFTLRVIGQSRIQGEVLQSGLLVETMQGYMEANDMGVNEEDVFQTKTPMTIEECRNAVQSIFSETTCYDLIQQSAKVIVFLKTIPCHMAFYALIEHDANVAPIWDPARHTFVAMMTVSDYIRALTTLCNAQNISMLEFQQKSIAEIMDSSVFQLEHPEFSSVDAEDSIQMMCYYFNRTQYDYVPVVNPDDGSLLSVLGYLDIPFTRRGG